ncbi:CLUMA_CG014826, isoform A [Clunio marinus]|uniref:CLUMA_CG014826, isoform A n=1 Tax=Clunio marinus TaxID=568069 RepID=A0A1J1IR79_9DIPT|nr:CLUMA_CG014826, isoform A [Clunio marinus]
MKHIIGDLNSDLLPDYAEARNIINENFLLFALKNATNIFRILFLSLTRNSTSIQQATSTAGDE